MRWPTLRMPQLHFTLPKNWWRYLLLGFTLYLLFLIINIPATWAAWGTAKATGRSVILSSPVGTLWRGKAELLISLPNTSPQKLGQVGWRLNPLWLATGRIGLTLSFLDSEIQGKGQAYVGFQHTKVSDSKFILPASYVAELYAPAKLIAPQGQIWVTVKALEFREDGAKGQATLHWKQAASSLSSVQPLGDYQLNIKAADKKADIELSTLGGSLELKGSGKWDINTSGMMVFNGTAVARQQADELQPLLQLMGTDGGNGRRNLRFNARLRLGR